MEDQIEAEVTERPAIVTGQVSAREAWQVWHVGSQSGRWELERVYAFARNAEARVAGYEANGSPARLVHYTLPALTIKAEEK